MPKNPELRKVWEQRIADYRKSGQTQVNWCKENQWSIHQFKYWLRKIENPIKNQGKSTKWASVPSPVLLSISFLPLGYEPFLPHQ